MERVSSAHDQRCVKQLIKVGMFTDIVRDKLNIKDGVVIVPCSDGHQFEDSYNHISTICKEEYNINCIHPVALNGGALLMSGNLMGEEERRAGEVMFKHVLQATKIKATNHIMLFSHFPCAVAVSSRLTVFDQGIHLMAAKRRLKDTNANLRISCFFHVYEAEGEDPKRRTYFLPKEIWENPERYMPFLHEFQASCRG